MDGQYHLIRLRGIVQRLILISQPEKFLLPIPLTDVRTQFHEGIVNGGGHCIRRIQIAGALNGNCPLVVGTAGRTPGAVLLLHAKSDLSILSDAIIAAGLSGGAGKASADTLRRQLAYHTVGRDPVNGMRPLPGVVRAYSSSDSRFFTTQLLFHIFLNLGVDLSVYFGKVTDISNVVGKNDIHCVLVALTFFYFVRFS